MTELNSYLARHFLDETAFAALCELTRAELRALVLDQLIPAPSYVVAHSQVTSYVFGSMKLSARIAAKELSVT